MRTLFLLLFLACTLTTGMAQVTLYDNCNYTGRNISLNAGDYSNLANFIGNATLSSLIVPSGYSVELFTGVNFSGTSSGRITSNITCLGTSFNNRVYSLRILLQDGSQPGGSEVYFYSGCQFSGLSRGLREGNYNLSNAQSNFAPQSLRIPYGMVVELYAGSNFTGASTGKITSDNDCLGGWISGKARSARVYGQSGPGGPGEGGMDPNGIRVFDAVGYGGNGQYFQTGRYNNLGGFNDRIVCVQVPAGYRVVLYEHSNFGGRSVTLTSNTDNLATLGMFAIASSMMVEYPGSGSGGGPGSNSRVTFYNSCNYGGRNRQFATGNFSYLSNSQSNFPPQSLRVPHGMVVELYAGSNFTGASTGKITNDIDCLGDWIKGKARSAKVYWRDDAGSGQPGIDPNGIRVFDAVGYGGAGQYFKLGNYSTLGGFNDRVVCVQVPTGYRVILYEHPNFGGRSVTLTSNTDNLATLGMFATASSMIVEYNKIQPQPK